MLESAKQIKPSVAGCAKSKPLVSGAAPKDAAMNRFNIF